MGTLQEIGTIIFSILELKDPPPIIPLKNVTTRFSKSNNCIWIGNLGLPTLFHYLAHESYHALQNEENRLPDSDESYNEIHESRFQYDAFALFDFEAEAEGFSRFFCRSICDLLGMVKPQYPSVCEDALKIRSTDFSTLERFQTAQIKLDYFTKRAEEKYSVKFSAYKADILRWYCSS